MQISDNELIAQFLTYKDQAVFAELLKRYQSPIRQFLRRLTAGDHATVDDLAQETFMRMLSSLDTFRGDSKLSTWLHKIAYHCFLRNQESNSKMHFADASLLTNLVAEPSNDMSDIMLEQLMAYLNIDERLMLTLSLAAGMSHSEIATVTGAPLGTIKSHINRGKVKLTKLLNLEESAA